jgi:hypothetical protein
VQVRGSVQVRAPCSLFFRRRRCIGWYSRDGRNAAALRGVVRSRCVAGLPDAQGEPQGAWLTILLRVTPARLPGPWRRIWATAAASPARPVPVSRALEELSAFQVVLRIEHTPAAEYERQGDG